MRYSDFLNWLSWSPDIKHTRHWQWEKVPSCRQEELGAGAEMVECGVGCQGCRQETPSLLYLLKT